jgi:ribonuclease E
MKSGAPEIPMPKRMLIDASHPEETRVVVLDGQKVEEFDFEAATKRPLKGNIYLAKVTRVEPSLQAAFVEYGGNRQGFLAFSEIHPDYYQIPVADRLALIAEQEADARRRQDDDVESFEISSAPRRASGEAEGEEREDEDASAEESDEHRDEPHEERLAPADAENGEAGGDAEADEVYTNHPGRESDDRAHDEDGDDEEEEEQHAETHLVSASGSSEPDGETASESEIAEIAETEIEEGVADEQSVAGAAAELEERAPEPIDTPDPSVTDNVPDMQTASEPMPDAAHAQQALQAPRPPQRWMRRRHYKIQEVIKRRQVILVQVVKEERGNKGAALTTYLSLAGRYCVLMPNTPRGGGISRKITNATDRNRLKAAAQSLELPEGMGLIIRTAGEARTKIEIKRDYEYLLRMWDTIRELTLKSNAPSCVYEEGDLIKRAIRDLYNKDVDEILVEGDDGYRNAKEFMRMLMPSHAKNVKFYKEPVPLFQRHHIEAQLDAMFSPTVTLRSGGYIVINQTEALVSIDVNSGRATREHSIEETAHKTNLEAAEEIARQLRLRDLAGLIVIDFIDMEDGRNDRDVEKRLRDAVKNDRARVQIGKISQFGLLEMSRQRLRAGVIAGSTVPCPHCGGQGIVRSVESTALRVLRGLEEEGQKMRASAVTVRVASDVAIYTLNQKRKELARLETDYGMTISFEPKEGLLAGNFDIERTVQKTAEERAKYAVSVEAGLSPPKIEAEEEPEAIEEEIEEEEAIEDEEILASSDEARPQQQHQHQGERGEREAGGRRRRRRRGGRNRNRDRDRGPQGERPREQREPHQQGSGAQPAHAELAASDAEPIADPGPDTGEGFAAEGAPLQQGQGDQGFDGRRRRRRRRRGRRGNGGGEPHAQSAGGQQQGPRQSDFGYDRFGQPDEIDTTPTDERAQPQHDAPAHDTSAEQPAHSSEPEPIATPNASSAPSWTLSAEREAETVAHDVPASAPPPEPAAQDAAEQAPQQPARKGWWQRTFKTES